MPDSREKKRRDKQTIERRGSGSGRRGSRSSHEESPSGHTRGERKKISLNESPTPIEQGGDYP